MPGPPKRKSRNPLAPPEWKRITLSKFFEGCDKEVGQDGSPAGDIRQLNILKLAMKEAGQEIGGELRKPEESYDKSDLAGAAIAVTRALERGQASFVAKWVGRFKELREDFL